MPFILVAVSFVVTGTSMYIYITCFRFDIFYLITLHCFMFYEMVIIIYTIFFLLTIDVIIVIVSLSV